MRSFDDAELKKYANKLHGFMVGGGSDSFLVLNVLSWIHTDEDLRGLIAAFGERSFSWPADSMPLPLKDWLLEDINEHDIRRVLEKNGVNADILLKSVRKTTKSQTVGWVLIAISFPILIVLTVKGCSDHLERVNAAEELQEQQRRKPFSMVLENYYGPNDTVRIYNHHFRYEWKCFYWNDGTGVERMQCSVRTYYKLKNKRR